MVGPTRPPTKKAQVPDARGRHTRRQQPRSQPAVGQRHERRRRPCGLHRQALPQRVSDLSSFSARQPVPGIAAGAGIMTKMHQNSRITAWGRGARVGIFPGPPAISTLGAAGRSWQKVLGIRNPALKPEHWLLLRAKAHDKSTSATLHAGTIYGRIRRQIPRPAPRPAACRPDYATDSFRHAGTAVRPGGVDDTFSRNTEAFSASGIRAKRVRFTGAAASP